MRLSLVAFAILFWAAMLVSSEDSSPMQRRPERFRKTKMQEIQDHYAVHGRGRYGKRQMQTIMQDSSVLVRDVIPPPIYFRNLQYYGNTQQDYDFDK